MCIRDRPGSALPWGGRGRRFESSRADQNTPKGPSGPFGVFCVVGARGFGPPSGLPKACLDGTPTQTGTRRSRVRSNPALVVQRQIQSEVERLQAPGDGSQDLATRHLASYQGVPPDHRVHLLAIPGKTTQVLAMAVEGAPCSCYMAIGQGG